jgi:tetratricopeptide (TPR) repeat protein
MLDAGERDSLMTPCDCTICTIGLLNETTDQGLKMLERKALADEITTHFIFLQLFIETNSASGLIDENIISEDFVASILNISHKWNLTNTNHVTPNTQSIDLLDAGNRIGVQVSSRIDLKKINSTITSLIDSEHREKIDELFFFSLKPKKFRSKVSAICPGVKFTNKNVLDFNLVLRKTKALSTGVDDLKLLRDIVVKNFAETPKRIIKTATAMSKWLSKFDNSMIGEQLEELLGRSFQTGETIKAQVILLIEKNEPSQAKELLDSLAKTSKAMAAQDLIDIANLYALLDSDQADIYYSHAASLNPESVKEANIYATSLMLRGRLPEAEKIFNACLEKADISPREREAVLGNLGFLYKNNGRVPDAIEAFEKALVISESIDHKIGRVKHLNGLSSCYTNLGNLELSEKYYNKAKLLLDEVMDNSKSETERRELRSIKSYLLTNLAIRLKYKAEISGDESLLHQALEVLHHAIDLAELLKDSGSLLKHYGNIANIYQNLKNLEKSREYNLKAYDLSVKEEEKRSQIAALLNLGLVDKDENDLPSAKSNLELALKLEENLYPNLRGHILASSSLIHKALGEHSRAKEDFAQAEQIYKKLGLRDHLHSLHVRFSQLDQKIS